MLTYRPSPLPTSARRAPDLAAMLSPLVVVSPHYDDAIFSCGNLLSTLPGSTVVTAYSGLPEDPGLSTDWDRRCGFGNAAVAMAARAAENGNALAAVRAEGVDLRLLDSQYLSQSPRKPTDLLADSLSATLARLQPATVFFPLGLFHEDHVTVADTALTVYEAFPAMRWFAYEDIPYSKRSDLSQQRFHYLAARGFTAQRFRLKGLRQDKAAAVNAYASQLKGLGHRNEQPIMQQPERYWEIYRHMDFH